MPRIILPICVLLCLGCSQEQYKESTYSKSEKAAYDAALESARHAIAAIRAEQDVIAAHQAAKVEAQTAQAELVQLKKSLKEAIAKYKVARSQAIEAYKWHDVKDSKYKKARAIEDEAWKIKTQVNEAKARAERATRIADTRALEVRQAKAKAEKAFQEIYTAAALAAFQHIADEAIKQAQLDPIAQH